MQSTVRVRPCIELDVLVLKSTDGSGRLEEGCFWARDIRWSYLQTWTPGVTLHTAQQWQPLRMIIPVILRQPPLSGRLPDRRGLLEASSSALTRHGHATWKKHMHCLSQRHAVSHIT